MSDSVENFVGGVVGSVIGFVASGGNPYGAVQGFAIGYSLTASTNVDPIQREGPRLEDLSVQSSSYGQPIPHVYGTFPVSGNIIWLENNELREEKETQSQGGKGGGGGVQTTTYTYYATFAVSLCEGPIGGIRRIWANGKNIYTATENITPDQVLGGLQLDGSGDGSFTIYYGTETQAPDPRIEADRGTAPAWRGTAYIVMEGLELSDYGNRIPQLEVEVVQPSSSDSRPRVIASRTFDWSALGVDFYEATDFLRFEQDTVVLNLDPSDPRPDSGDGSNAYDFRFSTGLAYLGNEPNPHADWPNVSQPDDAGLFVGRVGQWDIHASWREKLDNSANVFAVLHGRALSASEITEQSTLRLRASDEGKEQVGAFITPDERHLMAIWTGSSQLIYRIYDEDGIATNTWIERGTISVPTDLILTGNGSSTEATAAIESDLARLWIIDRDYGVALYERNSADAFEEVGRLDQDFTFSETVCALADNKMCCISYGSNLAALTAQPLLDAPGKPLQEIIDDLADRADIVASDVDTSGLTDTVRGCAVARPMPLRQALEPLRKAFPLDTIESGYQIRFKPRGGSAVVTVTDADLAAREPGQDQPAVLTTSREQETELPRRVRVRHRSVERDYEFGSEYAGRLATDSEHVEQIDLPLVLTAQEAAEVADILLRERWATRDPMEGATHWGRLALEAGDVITLDTSVIAGTARVTRVDDGQPGLRQLQLVPDSPGLYSSDAIGTATAVPSQGPAPAGPTALALLDLPALRDADNGAGFYVAMGGYLDGWRGAQLLMSPNDSTYAAVTAATDDAIMGRTNGVLADGPVGIWDRGNTVNVSLVGGGTLSSVTEREVLDGANTFAIASGSGWEIVQAADITLESDGSYTLSTLLRGRRGTEWATSGHADGDRVVALTSDTLSRVPRTVDSIDSERFYKAVSIGTSAARVDPTAFTYAGVNLTPYSPVHPRGSRNSSGDLTISWVRRTRIGGAWRDRVGVPVSEDSESYEVDVMDGSTVVRTLTSASPSVTYSASDQTTDFGSTQSAVTVRIYQMSAAVGRGYPLEVTV